MPKPGQIKYYEDLLAKHGDHFLSLDWKSPESQRLRFNIFEEIIALTGKTNNFSMLDVGCGFGDLYGYLKGSGYKFDYTGYDIAPKIIETAKRKYPDARFEIKDILDCKNPKQFDFVFCCGALNISFEEKEAHLDFIQSMLIVMFELCKIGVGVNFLSTQAVYYLPEDVLKQSQYFYSDPERIIRFSKAITSRYILRHEYNPGDFTVVLLK